LRFCVTFPHKEVRTGRIIMVSGPLSIRIRKSVAAALAIACVGLVLATRLPARSEATSEAEKAYKDYVEAWRTQDTAALQRLISDEYMAVNFGGKLKRQAERTGRSEERPELERDERRGNPHQGIRVDGDAHRDHVSRRNSSRRFSAAPPSSFLGGNEEKSGARAGAGSTIDN